jgi:hypothetical protein
VPSALAAAPVGTRTSSRRRIVWTAAYTIATIASFPIAGALAFTGLGLTTLVVPFLMVAASARKNASLFYPEIALTVPPGPYTRASDGDFVVQIGHGREIYRCVVVKVRVTYDGEPDNTRPHADRTRLTITPPLTGTEHRIAVRDVIGDDDALPGATFVVRVQGYVDGLPDATIDADLTNP